MDWKSGMKDYFGLSRKDRIGILVLLSLIVIVFLLPSVFSRLAVHSSLEMVDTSWMTSLRYSASSFTPEKDSGGREDGDFYRYDRSVPTASLFYFDPNTLPPAEWKRLGLRDRTIQTIERYRQKGGKFYKAEDLQRVYGLSTKEYNRLLPFVKIEKGESPTRFRTDTILKRNSIRSSPAVIHINTADTSAFIALPGIGSKLAARIINFREKLGGFYHVAQVGEVYGLADSVFQKIKPMLAADTFSIRKINLNKVAIDELKNHPYVRYPIASAIIAYRQQHGPFSTPGDIRKIMAVSEEFYRKMAPYLMVE